MQPQRVMQHGCGASHTDQRMHAMMQRRRGAYHVLPVPLATPVRVRVMTVMVVMTVVGPRCRLLMPGLCLRLLAHRIALSHGNLDAGLGQSLCHEQAVGAKKAVIVHGGGHDESREREREREREGEGEGEGEGEKKGEGGRERRGKTMNRENWKEETTR
jgi:hypothetical protein